MATVHVIGSVQSASFVDAPGAAAAFCVWELRFGEAWGVLRGEAGGTTQTAAACGEHEPGGAPGAGRSCAWEQPVDVTLRCASLCGWPTLQLTLWKQDEGGANEVCGYGCARVPPGPGLHALEMACWRPEGSALQELAAAFLGGGLPHLTDATMVARPLEGRRHAVASATAACVRVELNVLCKGFAERGIAFEDE